MFFLRKPKNIASNGVAIVYAKLMTALAGLLALTLFLNNHPAVTAPSDAIVDLIGQGAPVAVLVNNGHCIGCGEVIERAHAAMEGLNTMQLKVADTCTRDGKQFIERYNAEPVSVLLFDEAGAVDFTIRGIQSTSTYHDVFQRWIEERWIEERWIEERWIEEHCIQKQNLSDQATNKSLATIPI